MYRLAVFAAAFLLLACVITAVSASVYDEPETESKPELSKAPAMIAPTEKAEVPTEPTESEESADAPDAYIPRVTAPDYTNAFYYSDENIFYASDYGMPNCTCYAWGRAYELLGERPELCLYDACYWYDYNLETGAYDCGDTPREGAIACWAYSDGGSGHVAVVESVDGDTITFSNSAYSGTEFYVSTAPVSDPSNGMAAWIFLGYIYII